MPIVTVDAPSTRDIDDAISVAPADADGAVRLLVSIADVSAAIAEGSALDEEAASRGTSVYLPDRVLPMLPTELSEERLSLLPGQDRPCICVEIRVDPEGQVRSVDVYRSLIRSRQRLSYEQVAAVLDRGETDEATASVAEMLSWCRTASARLGMARARRGGVEMAPDDVHVVVDPATRRTTAIEPMRVTSAHRMIERFMVTANEAVAAWLGARGAPAAYRVHAEPDEAAVRRLGAVARNFGFEPGFGARLSPLALAAFERQIHESPRAPAILAVLARALGPARYTVHPESHFGLGADRYLHFTSPIRRYADLLVHRAVGAYLDGTRPSDARPPELEARCAHLNRRARLAALAERDCRRIASARFMAARLGETFEGNVVGVRPFGLQVQLTASLVVGSVGADSLPRGPYRFVEDSQELAGPRDRFAVGVPVRVRAVRIDEMLGRVDLELA
jgi:ribonuclease R